MKIDTPEQSYDRTEAIKDLESLLAQPLPFQEPPCPGCERHKPNSCNPKCPDATRALSIEPDRYPIEPQVTALVYQLYATRIVQPCWSCEGHVQTVGEETNLWKLPQVSFYCHSPVYIQLLNRCLKYTGTKQSLAYPWHIVISEYSQSLDLTYSIQPNLNMVNEPKLGCIQSDLRLIAENLLDNIRREAQMMLSELKQKS